MAVSAERLAEERREGKALLMSLIPIYIPQVSTAVLLTVGVLYGGYYLCDCIPYPKSDTLQDKLVYFIRCCVLPCVAVLCWAIVSVAMKRASSRALNPLSGYEEFVQPQKNILNNTVEQLLVFLMTCLVLTTYLDNTELRILPLYSLLWVTGRLTFAIGYAVHPKYRSLGMWIGFLTTYFFIGVIAYLVYTRGFMFGVETETKMSTANPVENSVKAEL